MQRRTEFNVKSEQEWSLFFNTNIKTVKKNITHYKVAIEPESPLGCAMPLNSSCSELPELHKALRGGRSVPPLKKSETWLKINFLKFAIVCNTLK